MILTSFISVTGITKRELPKDTCSSGILIMSVPGLYTGGNTNLRNKAPGLVAFLRTEKSVLSGKKIEQINCEWCRKQIILPFITKYRVTLYGMNDSEPVPSNLVAIF